MPENVRDRMPVLFVGHGNPMNAIEDNEFSRAWAEAARSIPVPEGILCISAHWETAGTLVTVAERPETIHDFYGFPRPLYDMEYPAPGSPALARLAEESVYTTRVWPDPDRGLDHGAWAVLSRMFPDAGIPVVQLSLDRTKPPAFHFRLGEELKALRDRGILVLCSGNIVHNLRVLAWEGTAYEWAVEFDETVKLLILSGDHDAIVDYPSLGRAARLSVPTNEHYLPLLYALAMREKDEDVSFFAEKVTLGSVSMRSLRIG